MVPVSVTASGITLLAPSPAVKDHKLREEYMLQNLLLQRPDGASQRHGVVTLLARSRTSFQVCRVSLKMSTAVFNSQLTHCQRVQLAW